ncbi:MAG: hypothetical protein FD145_1475 [Candidatus Saganbacteria bacterium]|uniref:DUF4129 domain-containing protein n=1 Tax=Candidatus Saganbacteria bacterium TaxID=2575572 RepID=A0A833KZT3_UNCSA|nr:MAG: hypothetical protein FD145_1475 [Candidatus Saganbacteria bacterium]
MMDIRDIKGVIGVFDLVSFLFVLVLVVVVFLIGYYIFKRLKQRNLKFLSETEKKVPEKPFDEIALEALNKIDPLSYYEKLQFKEYYILLTEIIRRFLAQNYLVDTLDKTSFEIIAEIEEKERDYEKVKLLDGYFKSCDIVKFAKYKPTLAEMKEAKLLSLGIVKEFFRKNALQ